MDEALPISFSAISLLLWVMLWLLGIVKNLLPVQNNDHEEHNFVAPGILYGVAVLIGFSVAMFVGFIVVPKGGNFLLANVGIALVVVQSIILILAPYIIGITTNKIRKVSSRSLILVHIVGTLWIVWIALMMELLLRFLATGSEGYSMLSLLSTFFSSIFVVFIAYLEFMWIVGRKLNGVPKFDDRLS